MIVTATGMSTEVGHISGMLSGVEQEKTPLAKQLDQLTIIITIMAAAALIAIILIGLARGDDFDELFFIGISLADRGDPDGLCRRSSRCCCRSARRLLRPRVRSSSACDRSRRSDRRRRSAPTRPAPSRSTR